MYSNRRPDRIASTCTAHDQNQNITHDAMHLIHNTHFTFMLATQTRDNLRTCHAHRWSHQHHITMLTYCVHSTTTQATVAQHKNVRILVGKLNSLHALRTLAHTHTREMQHEWMHTHTHTHTNTHTQTHTHTAKSSSTPSLHSALHVGRSYAGALLISVYVYLCLPTLSICVYLCLPTMSTYNLYLCLSMSIYVYPIMSTYNLYLCLSMSIYV